MWHMPLDDAYFSGMKSTVADMRNAGPRVAGGFIFFIFFVDIITFYFFFFSFSKTNINSNNSLHRSNLFETIC